MGKITSWKRSRRVTVYPHLELDQRDYSHQEMLTLVENLKSELPELNIKIYKQSTFCKELNGEWNVCFAVQGHPSNNPNIKISYTYIIRSCDDFKKTYGCPFINSDYFYRNITGLMKSLNEPLFNIIESKLMELVPSAKKVDYFDT